MNKIKIQKNKSKIKINKKVRDIDLKQKIKSSSAKNTPNATLSSPNCAKVRKSPCNLLKNQIELTPLS